MAFKFPLNKNGEIINEYNLPIDKTNYFVKKAEIMLKKVLKR